MREKINVGILGATGTVGQRFIALLDNHPWFEVVSVSASPRSAGKTYQNTVQDRWVMTESIPQNIAQLVVQDVQKDIKDIANNTQLVFSALDMDKESICEIENAYATLGVGVISNNSAHRWTPDVPMIMPEINPEHAQLIDVQRKNRDFQETGFIAVKPNCSIQSYVPVISALTKFEPTDISVTNLQAISGAGKTFETWSEMVENIIPYINGEEEKSEQEPLKILGTIQSGEVKNADMPNISATCIRVPVLDGHMASVSIKFKNKPNRSEIINAIENFDNPIAQHNLPSAPKQLMKYIDKEDRPQAKLDCDYEDGMGVTVGRLRESNSESFDWQFIALAHNTIRGAAGGAILMAELLKAKKYL